MADLEVGKRYIDMLTHDAITPLAPHEEQASTQDSIWDVSPESQLDLRLEGVTANRFVPPAAGGFFFYYEVRYRILYLHNGNWFGSWIGRAANGYQAWSTCHLGPKTSVQWVQGNVKNAKDYIPRQIVNFSAVLRRREEIEFKGFVQYESWLEPVLASIQQRDVTAQFTWWPGLVGRRPQGWNPRSCAITNCGL